MTPGRSHLTAFCYEVMPALFHAQTGDFVRYLRRDGLSFLQFWWDHLGQKLPADLRQPFGTFTAEWYPALEGTDLVFLTFPAGSAGEPCELACAAGPRRRFAWVRLDQPQLFCLLRPGQENGAQTWGFITPRGNFQPQGTLAPGQTFRDMVLRTLKKDKPA